MKVSAEELKAIRAVVIYGRQFGYGNLISHLKSAWVAELVADGLGDEAECRGASNTSALPVAMHRDILERGEWDETGRRYAKKASPKNRKAPR